MVELRITEPIDGAILDLSFAERGWVREAEDGRWLLRVKGVAPAGCAVTVNGVAARRRGTEFTAWIPLRPIRTRIAAVADAADGARQASVIVYWRDASQKKYRISVDDNILFLKDIAQHKDTYSSIFDQWYLKFWREMHERYGARVHFNVYWRTDGFNLAMTPDKFRDEWRDNADWLRLTFHARANDPPKPYATTPYEEIRSDYLVVTEQIARFAGPELLSDFTTCHWGSANLESCRALRDCGVRGLVGYFQRQNGEPHVAYYLDGPKLDYLMREDYWMDNEEDILFIRNDMVINELPLAEIRPQLEAKVQDQNERLIELMIHEQYFWECTGILQPDAKEKVATALETVAPVCEPVFFGEEFKEF